MKGGRLALVLAVTMAACTGSPSVPSPTPSATAGNHGAIVRLQTVAIPEGPPAPAFERGAKSGDTWVRPMRDTAQYVPAPLPEVLEQPAGCSFGGDLVVTFEDGSELPYGPCRRPPSTDQLWAWMIYVLDNGRCAPKCGPGGEFGPFEFAMHVPKPQDIGQPDWGDEIILSAWQRVCARDQENDGFHWRGRGFDVSATGMVVDVTCDDGLHHAVKVVFDSTSE
jgi:hypothetical protein